MNGAFEDVMSSVGGGGRNKRNSSYVGNNKPIIATTNMGGGFTGNVMSKPSHVKNSSFSGGSNANDNYMY
jgi:hypothetical protein